MSEVENHKSSELAQSEMEDSRKRLSKRLAYLLRYGAVKEGLDVDDNGYVELSQLCQTHLLHRHSKAEVLEAIKSSTSYRHTKRYDCHERNGLVYVRAAYLRNFEKSPFHKDTKVKTLFEFSMSCILDNLDDFDLEDFPDEHILRAMMRRLKREKKLTSKALKVLLAPTITQLDLEGVYLTNSTLRLVWTQCPHLRAVSLRDCGYIITDTILAQFTKNLPCLERLNLCLCTHLTNKSLTILAKNLPRLHTLHFTRIPSVNYNGVFDYLKKSAAVKFLDVYYLRTTPEEYETLVNIAQAKQMTLVLREPRKNNKEEDEASSAASNDANNCGESDSDEALRQEDGKILYENLMDEMWIED